MIVAKTPLADKVSSSGYGKVAPPQGEKKAPPPSAPVWSPSKKAPAVLDLPEPIKPKGYSHVSHSGYGSVSPPKSDRPQKEFAPKWTPNSPKVNLGQPEPVRSRLYEHVASSGYASSDYTPATSYRNHEQRCALQQSVSFTAFTLVIADSKTRSTMRRRQSTSKAKGRSRSSIRFVIRHLDNIL